MSNLTIPHAKNLPKFTNSGCAGLQRGSLRHQGTQGKWKLREAHRFVANRN